MANRSTEAQCKAEVRTSAFPGAGACMDDGVQEPRFSAVAGRVSRVQTPWR